jgi:class 3 adenylate cyclase
MSTLCPSCGAEAADDARFCASCGTSLSPTAPREDELRPVTALFADVVGSTRLGERLAPEEVKALVGECVSRMSRAVEEFGGRIQAYQGDGICAYFGVPAAHEDDPERAARAALRILEIVGEYGRDIEEAWAIPDFGVRVGVNSGQAAVGLVGGAEPQAVALGDTTNVAARLESQAAPGTIAVGEATMRRLGDRFVLEPLGELSVKGRSRAVRGWRLVRPQDTLASPPTTPVVDRERELERIRDTLDDLRAGRGRVLLLSGEAGIGKTRLLTELRALAGDDVTWLEGDCVSYGAGLHAWPFAQMLRDWLGLKEGEPEVAVRTKARARLGADVLPALGRLLTIRVDERGDLDLHTAYATWVQSLAATRPVVVALEDLHWADPATRELAERLLELTERSAVLVVATFEPDTAAEASRFRLRALAEYPHRTTELALDGLPEEAASQLLGLLLPGALDELTRREVARSAEGNPLYLEELLRALADGFVRRRTWTVTAGSAELLPPALGGLLVARIDRLPESARRLAQTAAVIGRSFPVRVLEQVAGSDVQPELTALLRAEVVREQRRYPDLECAFRHGLLREAALSTLTPARLRELYSRVAAAFEELYAAGLDDHLERLAHYYAQSDDRERARSYLGRAARRASERGDEERAERLEERRAALR